MWGRDRNTRNQLALHFIPMVMGWYLHSLSIHVPAPLRGGHTPPQVVLVDLEGGHGDVLSGDDEQLPI